MGPSGRVLKPYVAERSEYQHVLIGGRKLRVHHAVLLAFVGPRPEGAVARHLNDVASDNRVENLAWGTIVENAGDRHRRGGYVKGETDPDARLTNEQVRAIRSDSRSSRIVGHAYGVSHTTVQKIRRGEMWSHVDG